MSAWQVVALEGTAAAVRGVVVELMTSHPDEPATVVAAADLGIDESSLGDALRIVPWDGHHAVLVPDTLLVAFAGAIAGTNALRVAGRRTIAEASFDFEAAASSRDAAAAIRAALRAPHGVRLAEHAEHEDEQASERDGVRVRRYAFRTRGRVDGSVTDVLAFRRRLADVDATGRVRLRLA